MKRHALLLPFFLISTSVVHALEVTPSIVAATTRWDVGGRVADPGAGVALNIRPASGPEWGVAYLQHRTDGDAENVLAIGPRWKTAARWHVGASPQLVAMKGRGQAEVRPGLTLTGGYNGYHLDMLLMPSTRARPQGAWLWIRSDL